MFGAGSSDLAIGISLIMRDQFSGTAANARRELSGLSDAAQQSVTGFQEAQRNFNATGAAVGGAAVVAMGKMLQTGAEFDTTLTYISNIAKEKGGIGFKQLGERAMQLGLDSMFSAQQVNDAMKYLAMSGMDTQEIYNNIAGAVALASATMSNLDGKLGTADIMTNVMHAFQIEGTEENAMRVADILSKAVTSANTNLTDLAEAMKYAQGTAHSLGLGVEETAAIIMTLGNAGIQGSMAGTAAENMLRYLSRMGDEARKGTRQGKALSALGLSPDDLKTVNGELRSISEIFGLIGMQLGNMGDVDALNVLQDMFGVRGARAAVLLKEIQSYNKNLNTLNNESAGTALKNQEAQMASLGGLIDELKGSIETFGIVWTNAIKPLAGPAIKFLSQTIEAFSSFVQTPIGGFLTKLATIGILAKTAYMGFRAILLSIRLLQGGLTTSMNTIAGTGRAAIGATTGVTAAQGSYNGVVSQTLARLQRVKGDKTQILALQRQLTAEVLRTAMAENAAAAKLGTAAALTAAQRAKLMQTTAMATTMSGTSQMLLGASGVAAMGGIGAWLARRGIGRFNYVDARGRMRNHRHSFVSPKTNQVGYTAMGANTKFGRAMGGMGGIGAMVGGIGLDYAANAAGRDTALGKGLSVGSSALTGLSMGAMIGSVVPVIGTTVGAIVGGVGGLLYGLYDNLKEVEKGVDEAKAEADKQSAQPFWQDSVWREKTRKLLDLPDGSTVYTQGGRQPLWMGPREQALANQTQLNNGNTRVVINIDGKSAMDREFKARAFEEILNLQIF